MCTILFSWKTRTDYPLILLANRDEFYERPTKTAHWWEDYPSILGGRDLQAGGTWMGINKNGRFSAITNFRKLPLGEFNTSRGDLVKDFLTGNESPSGYLRFLEANGANYEGFNLLFGNLEEMFYYSNRGPSKNLEPSIYGLSNHLLDTPWPKVTNGKMHFENEIKSDFLKKDNFFSILSNEEIAEDSLLPETGIGLEKERMLSSMFIKSPKYGTRISTYLSIGKDGQVEFHERSFVPDKNEKKFNFEIS